MNRPNSPQQVRHAAHAHGSRAHTAPRRLVLCIVAGSAAVVAAGAHQADHSNTPPRTAPARVQAPAQTPAPAVVPPASAPSGDAGADPAALLPAQGAAPDSTQAFNAAVADARARLDAGDAAGAATLYEEALRSRPDSAPAAYNLGVAQYRAGKFKEASDAFARAAQLSSQGRKTDSALAADSLYNRAAGFYGATREQAEAAERMLQEQRAAGAGRSPDPALGGSTGSAPGGTPPDSAAPASGVDADALKQAVKDARTSLQGFKDAALANPADRDARANAEQATRLVRALEELQKAQQQQQQQNQDEQQQNQNPQDQKEQQDQQQQQNGQDQQQSQQSQQQGQPADNPADKEQNADDMPPKGEEDQQKQEQKDQPREGDQPDQQPPAQPESGEPASDNPGANPGEPREMTQEEADRLLQAVRDAEKRRRAQLEAQKAQRQPARRAPAKDW